MAKTMAEISREIEDVRILQKPTAKSVSLANQADLLQLASFIQIKLPHRSDLHNLVLAALNWVTEPPAVFVYFVRDDDNDEIHKKQTLNDDKEYSAIVAIRVDRSQSRKHSDTLARHLNSVSWFRKDRRDSLFRIWDSIGAIDWHSDIITIYVVNPAESIPEILAEHLNKKGMNLEIHPGNHYEMERKTALSLEIPDMKDVYVKSLEKHHASTVYKYWPYKIFATVEDVMDQIHNFPSAGVFLKENDQLVSWMVYRAPWGMGKLHTLQEHRKKGYASLVTKYMSKRMAQSGYIPSVIIEKGNNASCAFFESLGFKCFGEMPIFVEKLPPSVSEAILKNFSS